MSVSVALAIALIFTSVSTFLLVVLVEMLRRRIFELEKKATEQDEINNSAVGLFDSITQSLKKIWGND